VLFLNQVIRADDRTRAMVDVVGRQAGELGGVDFKTMTSEP